jgi:choline dehydrogenase-like flavoprotein
MDIGVVVVTPISRKTQSPRRHTYTNHPTGGSIILNSSNALDPPIIDPGFLTSDFDLFVAREAIKRAHKFVTAPVWKDYILAPTVNMENFTTDELDQFIRNSAATINHPVGTASMSARDALYGVVDPDLLVKGTRGLSVIDASVLVRFIGSGFFFCGF